MERAGQEVQGTPVLEIGAGPCGNANNVWDRNTPLNSPERGPKQDIVLTGGYSL